MISIPIHNKAGAVKAHALVDDNQAHAITSRWSLNRRGNVMRLEPAGPGGHRQCIYLHRYVLGLTDGDGNEVRHQDKDRLNCQGHNLTVFRPIPKGTVAPSPPVASDVLPEPHSDKPVQLDLVEEVAALEVFAAPQTQSEEERLAATWPEGHPARTHADVSTTRRFYAPTKPTRSRKALTGFRL